MTAPTLKRSPQPNDHKTLAHRMGCQLFRKNAPGLTHLFSGTWGIVLMIVSVLFTPAQAVLAVGTNQPSTGTVSPGRFSTHQGSKGRIRRTPAVC